MQLLALLTAAALFAMLARITYRAYRGDFQGNPFLPVLMILLTTATIGGLCAAAAM
jgi:hypothetical protein